MAELADALDSKSITLRLLKLTHGSSSLHKVYQRGESWTFKLALLCSLLLIVGLQISESPALAQSALPSAETAVRLLLPSLTAPQTMSDRRSGRNIARQTKVSAASQSMSHPLACSLSLRDELCLDQIIDARNKKRLTTIERIIADGSFPTVPAIIPQGSPARGILREFSSVRIDYKAQTVTLEQ